MKRKSKILLLSLALLLLLSVGIVESLAYMTDTTGQMNVFTSGNVRIALDEAKVDPDGSLLPGEPRVLGNHYHLLPGGSYAKDPTLRVLKGSTESYVRIFVRINEISDLQHIFGADFQPADYVSGWDAALWPCVSVSELRDDSLTYEFRYKEVIPAAKEEQVLPPLFTGFTLPASLSGEELALLEGLEISLLGQAVQSTGFANADEAWAAFSLQYPSLPL